MNDDSRFFTMKQLWQSLGITAVVAGAIILMVTYSVHKSDDQPQAKAALVATTSQPAAAVEALPPKNPFTSLNLSGQAAIVVDLSNGQTLFSQNADKALPLASLTKLITLYGAVDELMPNSTVPISSTSLAQDGDYGFYEGETFAFKDISRIALVDSSNDAAEAIAEAAADRASETIPDFLVQSIQKAGLTNTTAQNGTGLDLDLTHAGAFGSARDIAKLANEFLTKAPDLAAATTKSSVSGTSLSGTPHSYSNTNYDVSSMTGVKLSKTGYTDIAGGNLVVIFDAGINHPIAVVILGSTASARFTDVEKLMHAARLSFANSPS